jgi:diaminohydroxyphosphoribosylaminopyrimidine deaminase/5-amino-6-(5-phosphoribosylamino)uracil reductase
LGTPEQYMQRCLTLLPGPGYGGSNPMVGCVITDRNGVILGEGFHQQYGGAHAEVNALQQTGAPHCLRDAPCM